MQAIGVARAIYRDPSILVLDEPTNNLDRITKKNFFENLKKLSTNKICIIISHDQELLSLCDELIQLFKKDKND